MKRWLNSSVIVVVIALTSSCGKAKQTPTPSPTACVDHRVVAKHDRDTVRVSRDGGVSFREALAHPGRVRSVAVDCGGRVYALRGYDRIGVLDNGRERWHALPSFEPMAADMDDLEDEETRIATGGGYVVVLGRKRNTEGQGYLAVSDDHGVRWRFHELREFSGIESLAIDTHGVLRADLGCYGPKDSCQRVISVDLARLQPSRPAQKPDAGTLCYRGHGTSSPTKCYPTRAAVCAVISPGFAAHCVCTRPRNGVVECHQDW